MEAIIKRLMESHKLDENYLYGDEYKDMLRKITDVVWDRLLASVDDIENVLKNEVEGYDTKWSGGDHGEDGEEIHQLFTELSAKLALNMMKNCDVKW